MGNVRVVLNREAVREQLLRSSEMLGICQELAEGIAGRAGKDGYEVTTYVGRNRVNASIVTTSEETTNDNLKNNTLLRSML